MSLIWTGWTGQKMGHFRSGIVAGYFQDHNSKPPSPSELTQWEKLYRLIKGVTRINGLIQIVSSIPFWSCIVYRIQTPSIIFYVDLQFIVNEQKNTKGNSLENLN